jgi:hypothetical protein
MRSDFRRFFDHRAERLPAMVGAGDDVSLCEEEAFQVFPWLVSEADL